MPARRCVMHQDADSVSGDFVANRSVQIISLHDIEKRPPSDQQAHLADDGRTGSREDCGGCWVVRPTKTLALIAVWQPNPDCASDQSQLTEMFLKQGSSLLSTFSTASCKSDQQPG
ncbi:hypothetical protein SKAU_G00266470 [Synaphobranchus kaupii]|uniref:Uncharacterized protein n=1 Tax=Synaphobranchus kaupii TaxID=118154 RepID=A0A9Q1IN28_SYNKA|nr:hypothetical protein SKAU_G00266470 [Synaphobranchus kaupii]